MKFKFTASAILASVAATVVLSLSGPAIAADGAAAEKLARQEGCLRCHGIDRGKDGPSYKSIAEKNKGKADAEARIIKHLSTGHKVKFEDGHEEDHKIPKTKDAAQITNLVQWILSL